MAGISLILFFCWLVAVHSQTDIIIQAPPSIAIGYDDLDVRCSPDPAWSIQSITRIQLYKDTKGLLGSSDSELVFMYLNLTVMVEQFQWSDSSVRARGGATGSLSPTIDSFMRLLIPASSTVCNDAANYRCEISGTNFGAPSSSFQDFNVVGLGRADEITDVIVVLQSGYSSNVDQYDYNSVLEITCNATVGLPPLSMHWCLRTSNTTEFSPFPSLDQISTSEITPDGGCQYRQESVLVHRVTEVDMETTVMCEVTNVSDCTTNLLNISYSFDVVFGRINLNATTNITLRQDPLDIDCYQATTGEGLTKVDRLDIFRNSDDGTMTPIVSVVMDNVTGESVIEWYDPDLRERAFVTGNVTAPPSAFIMMTIPANLSVCDDIGTYRCSLAAVSVAGTVVSDHKDITIHADALPEEISPLHVQDSAGVPVTPGGAVQLGETITITCNGTVGSPPQSIGWCIRRHGGVFTKYPQSDDVTMSDVYSVDACQNSQSSTLAYNVTSGDIETTFLCDIGGGDGCGDGVVTSQVSIYAVDLAIGSDVPVGITAGVDDLLITCYQTASGIGLLYDPVIRLYRNTSDINDNAGLLLVVTTSKSTNQSIVTWYDNEFESRAAASADITNLTSAYLAVSMNASHVTCLDDGYYRCVLDGHVGSDYVYHEDGGPVHITVHPEDMEEIVVRTDNVEVTDETSFPVGTQLTLVCNSTVGMPILGLNWCVRRTGEGEFTSWGPGDKSVPVPSGPCQYRQTSELNLNVTITDSDTLVMCEAGNTSTCGTGLVSRQVRIYAVDLAMTTDVTPTVLSGDRLNVSCYQSASGLGHVRHVEITIYRNTSDGIHTSDERVVSLRHNSTSNTSLTVWYADAEVVTRATVDGDVTDAGRAYLSLTIENITCLDQGVYRCEMTGVTLTNDWVTRTESKLVEVNVVPDAMEVITGFSDSGQITGEASLAVGSFLTLTCNGTVGSPPFGLHWCIHRFNESEFSRIMDSVTQQDPVSVSPCQYTRTSDVHINVTSDDIHTQFMCEAGEDWACTGGYVFEVFELFAVSADVSMDVTTLVTSGHNNISIACSQSGDGLGHIRDLQLTLFRSTLSANITMADTVVAVTYNSSTNQSDVTWTDMSTQHRASVRGSVVDMATAHIELIIGQDDVTCIDGGVYICELSGVANTDEKFSWQDQARVDILVPADYMESVTAHADDRFYTDRGSFISGTHVVLTCNGTVGVPPEGLTWCVWRDGEDAYTRYSDPSETESEPLPSGPCQYMRTGVVSYTVMSYDTHTLMRCEVGHNSTCDVGRVGAAFEIFVVDVSIDLDSPTEVIGGVDKINMTCKASDVTSLTMWEVMLYRNTTDQETDIVSFHYNSTTSGVTWLDNLIENRAVVTAWIEDGMSAILELSLGEEVTCADEGYYTCTVRGDTGSGEVLVLQDRQYIGITVLPDYIEDIIAQTNSGVYHSEGLFPVGSKVTLLCNSTVGRPPLELQWCVREEGHAAMVYEGIINQSAPISSGNCQYMRTSTLVYTVMSDDTRTEFMCDVGTNVTCGGGYISSVFTMFSDCKPYADKSLLTQLCEPQTIDHTVVSVVADSTQIVTSEVDTVNVTCSVSGLRLFYDWTLSIHRNASEDSSGEVLIISLVYSGITNVTRVIWWDTELPTRGDYSIDTTQTDTATFGIYIQGDDVTCFDGGLYRCELSGDSPSGENTQADDTSSVLVLVASDNMEEVRGEGDDGEDLGGGVFTVGSGLILTCNSSVGNPPLDMYWCVMTNTDNQWSLYPNTSHILLSDIISGLCDQRKISTLTTEVKDVDLSTLYLCEVGQNMTCGQGLINATFSVHAVDVSVAVDGTTSVIGGKDELQITCSQNASGIGLLENTTFRIYHHSVESQWHLLVSLTYNSSTGSDVITWHTTGMTDLWVAMGSITPLSSGYLQLTLPGANVTCREAGMYECALQGQVGTYSDVTRTDRLDVEVQVLPDKIERIRGQWGSTVVTVEGRFPVGGAVSLLCNSTVGDPPSNLYWIVKRANDTDYTQHNDTEQSQPSVSGSCQLRRTSRLLWTVTSADEETVFMCVAGPMYGAAYLNATFKIVAIPCEGDCSVVTTAVPPPSDGMTSGVIAASIVTPLLLLAMLMTLIVLWKFPGARSLLCKRKSYETKVKPQDSSLNIPLELNGVGPSAPPTGTSMTNGSAM